MVMGNAVAQVTGIRPAYSYPSESRSESGPASVQLGSTPLYAAPWAEAAFGNDSNLFSLPTDALSSPYQRYGLGFKADARSAQSLFRWDLRGELGRYTDSSNDDYNDLFSVAAYDVAFSSRSFLRVKWDYALGHDARGSTDRGILVGGEPDRYRVSTPGVTYSYGAPDAKGRVEVFASQAAKRYRNNRDITEASDRDTADFGAAFYWRLQPRTYLLMEARGTQVDYTLSSSTQDSDETRLYVGATWEATAITSGTVKVGQLQKKFDAGQPKFSGTSWEALVNWAPFTYSTFAFYTTRTPTESTGLGDFILSDAIGAYWKHDWNSRFSTEANLRYQSDNYKGFDRNDDITTLGLKANYRFRRWLTLGAEYTYTNRDSNLPASEYDRNVWLLYGKLSM
jgi:hypothetical protein